jgi:hypothetical protein
MGAFYDLISVGPFTPLAPVVDDDHPAPLTPVIGHDIYGLEVEFTYPDYIWTPGPDGDYARWPFRNDKNVAGDNVDYQWPGWHAPSRFRTILGGHDADPPAGTGLQWHAYCPESMGGASATVDLTKTAIRLQDPDDPDAISYLRIADWPPPPELLVLGSSPPLPAGEWPQRPPDAFLVSIQLGLRYTPYSDYHSDDDVETDPTIVDSFRGPTCGAPAFTTPTVTVSMPGAQTISEITSGELSGTLRRAAGAAYSYSTPAHLMNDNGVLIDPGLVMFERDELGTLSIDVSGSFHSVDLNSESGISVFPIWEDRIASGSWDFTYALLGQLTALAAGPGTRRRGRVVGGSHERVEL